MNPHLWLSWAAAALHTVGHSGFFKQDASLERPFESPCLQVCNMRRSLQSSQTPHFALSVSPQRSVLHRRARASKVKAEAPCEGESLVPEWVCTRSALSRARHLLHKDSPLLRKTCCISSTRKEVTGRRGQHSSENKTCGTERAADRENCRQITL